MTSHCELTASGIASAVSRRRTSFCLPSTLARSVNCCDLFSDSKHFRSLNIQFNGEHGSATANHMATAVADETGTNDDMISPTENDDDLYIDAATGQSLDRVTTRPRAS